MNEISHFIEITVIYILQHLNFSIIRPIKKTLITKAHKLKFNTCLFTIKLAAD